MSARDRHADAIVCTNCGERGVLHISEKDVGYLAKPDKEVERVEGKFSASVTDGGRKIMVTCGHCGAQFNH